MPHLLPLSRPVLSSVWPINVPAHSVEWGRTLLLPFLPIGFFGKLATRLLHFPFLHKAEWWQTGILFKVELKSVMSELVLIEFVDCGDLNKSLVIRMRTKNKSADIVRAFSQIIDSIGNLLDGFYPKLGASTVRLVPCTHCLLLHNPVADIFHFSQDKCVSLLLSGEQYAYCNDMPTRPVPLNVLIPDLALETILDINLANITKLSVIGEGGFGVVCCCFCCGLW